MDESPEPLSADPEIAALLEFEPVPRRARVNGWDADTQRAFIVALVATGSPSLAAKALGLNGCDGLRKAKGAEGFAAAWDSALALHAGRRSRRLKSGLARLDPGPAPEAEDDDDWPGDADDRDPGDLSPRELLARSDLTLQLLCKYALKLQQERTARNAGKIAEADFYLRQATFFEVAIDLAGPGLMHALAEFKIDGRDLFTIADTPASRVLDDVRRKYWDTAGEPERPPQPLHLLEDHGAFRDEPLECAGPASRPPSWVAPDEWRGLGPMEQLARYNQQYARDAAAYAQWLAKAARDFEQWRERGGAVPHSGKGEGEGGQ
jgi:hypothetical protein